MKEALRFVGVEKRYGKAQALAGLTFAVPTGAICGLVGPNGAGKTTTFGIVGGAIFHDAGEVDILGEGPFDRRRHGGRIALLPQDCELNPFTPVRQLLRHYARLHGLSAAAAERQVDGLLDEVELRDRGGARISELSHGMRRRVAVAQALIGNSELILLDEPTAGLDPHLVARMREVFLRRRGRCTLVVSSHVLVELEQTCDHVVVLERGRLVRQGPLAELIGAAGRLRAHFARRPGPGLLEAALPGVELRWRDDAVELIEAGADVSDLTRRFLRAVATLELDLLSLQRGRSLEEAYLEDRARAGAAAAP
jgi:ABC-type multidrug transport system ATPase subunit